ncbi:hypothetical protein PG994_003206 [Apiospora phragmitis]|uniref:SGNH hydrolase-type esterase domain-containing protein n=1 Tax=Apiospora phragmitis TaxID=2905665 RepID=A0ABR1W181_9PEZI
MNGKLDHEGVRGDIVTQVHQRIKNTYVYKPKVVLINAGTNDYNAENNAVDQIGECMGAMINDLWNAPDMGDTGIVLSSVLATTNPVCQPRRDAINGQYATFVDGLQQQGRPIVWAPMEWMTTDNGIGPDGVTRTTTATL